MKKLKDLYEESKQDKYIKNYQNLLKPGDTIEVVKPPMSKFKNFLNTVSSVMYDPKMQYKVGDKFLVEPTEYKDIYNLKNLNRPKDFFDRIDKTANTGPYKAWIEELLNQGKIVKI